MAEEDRVRRLVRRRIVEAGLTLAEVSLRIGRNHAYLQQFLERGVPRELPERVRPKLAMALGVAERDLRLDPEPDSGGGRERRPGASAAAPAPGAEDDLPVYASAQGGLEGMTLTPEPIDWLARPRLLRHVAKAFAVYVVGDSMDPAYRHGDMVLVHPGLPALKGDDVLLIRHESDRAMAGMVKHLVGWNDRHWRIRQFNPERDHQVSREEWQQAAVIVGKFNRR